MKADRAIGTIIVLVRLRGEVTMYRS